MSSVRIDVSVSDKVSLLELAIELQLELVLARGHDAQISVER